MPLISFIVPVRNDAARLEICLRSIRRNATSHGDLEVIVVDNGPSDGSSEVATRLGARVIGVEHVGSAELRNRGARQASGDILAFVDADNEIVPGWTDAATES